MKYQLCRVAVSLFVLASVAHPLFASDESIVNSLLSEDYSPEVQQLMANSYLGHQEELPDPGEPAIVLSEYLNFDSHLYVPPSPDQIPTLNQQIQTWQSLAQSFPYSRHALVGLARLYDIESSITLNLEMERNATNLYIQASGIAVQNGHIRYTSQIETLMVKLNDAKGLDDAFRPVLSQSASLDPIHYYKAQLDYAQGLSAFGDPKADMYFSQATQMAGVDHTFAADLYAEHLLSGGNPSKAFNMLDTVLTSSQRIRTIAPVFLRAKAARAAGFDTASSDSEIAVLTHLFGKDGPGGRFFSSSEVPSSTPDFVHNNPADDCRNPALGGKPVFTVSVTGGNWVFWPDGLNLPEVEKNEADTGTPWGAVDAVGWTIRDRFAANVCVGSNKGSPAINTICQKDTKCSQPKQGASFNGGCGWHTAASCIGACKGIGPCSTLPCSQSGVCTYSKNLCCAIHGGTHNPGDPQSEFNDAHVDATTRYNAGYLGAMLFLTWGYLPDMSVKLASGKYWTASGVNVKSCAFNCTSPICKDATRGGLPKPTDVPLNATETSINGPMEFRTCPWYSPADPFFEYQPRDSTMGWLSGNICGGGNCFANRCTKYQCTGP